MKKSTEFGLKSLCLGKTLVEGFTITVELGIYIIPALIDMWKATGKHKEFINYNVLETYKDFGESDWKILTYHKQQKPATWRTSGYKL